MGKPQSKGIMGNFFGSVGNNNKVVAIWWYDIMGNLQQPKEY